MYDVAIVGAGPAGISAAIALACEGKQVVVLEQSYIVGGQIAHSHLVENVAGYRNGFSGEDFAIQSYEQAISLGVDILLGHQVLRLYGERNNFILWTDPGDIHARAVLITVGVAPRPLPFAVLMEEEGCNITNELHLQPANPGEHVLVYGGGNSAGQAATYYARRGCTVTLLSRRPVQETMDARWIVTLASLGVYNTVGEIQHVDNDTVVFSSSGEAQRLIPHTLHAFTGGDPVTGWLDGWVQVDDRGYIVTDDHHCTTTPGIFAAGDCVSGSVKKFTCAVGGGCEAVPYIGQCLSLDASRMV
jgi:thioredoxin reductase (NADPH)